MENKIPDISNLATKTVLTTVENKIPSTSNTINTLATNVFSARIAQASLITNTDFDVK